MRLTKLAMAFVHTLSGCSRLIRTLLALAFAAASGGKLCAQGSTRPIDPGGGGIISPPIFPPIVTPPIVIPPVVPPTTISDARVVTEPGVLVGTIGRATVELPASTAASAGGSSATTSPTTRTSTATAPLYRWSIVNGKLLSDPADAIAEFTATALGTTTLNVSVTADGTAYSASTKVAVLPSNVAGAVTVASSVPSSSTGSVRASVAPAVNSDRTFRWSISGDGRITNGRESAEVTFTPGSPGVRELTCAITLKDRGSVTVRSYVVVTGNGPPVAVTVDQGIGGGTYPAGSAVHVFADPPAPGMVFDRWTGDVLVLGDDPLAPFLPHGTISVPAAPVTLAATYKPASDWSVSMMPRSDAIYPSSTVAAAVVEAQTMYHVPPGARGLVFLLHDTGGSAADWFNRAEELLLVRDLVAAGFGVAAVSSEARNWATQTTLATNPDARNLAAVLDRVAGRDGVPAALPVFVLGLGSGAQAAPRFTDILANAGLPHPVLGAVLLCGTGSEELAALSRVPVLFALADKDTSAGYAGAAAARSNAELMAGRGLPAGVTSVGFSPLVARRLLKLSVADPAFTSDVAGGIWTALRAAEIVDDNGYVKAQLSTDGVSAALPAALQKYGADVAAQLKVAAAARGVQSEWAPRIVDFLNQRLAGAGTPEPARIVNLSTRSRIAFVSDTFGLAFTLSGTERATILIRAVGPGLSRFGVATRCLATRLELYRGDTLVAANEAWDETRNGATQISAAATSVGAFPLTAGSLDSALLSALGAGTYEVLVKGVNGTSGDVLLEAYDVTRNATRFSRVAAIGRIDDPGADSLLTGFVVLGASPRTLLCRTIGPGLTQLGWPSEAVLPDPQLTVMDARGRTVAANDNWSQSNSDMLRALATRVGVVALPSGSNDAALVRAFQPGSFTLAAGAASAKATAQGGLMIELSEVP